MLLLSACGASEASSSVRQAIVNGEPSPAGPEDGTLLLLADVPQGQLCTAALIAPNLAVTARHCVVAMAAGDFLCTDAGQLQNDGSGAGLFGDEYAPGSLLFYGGPPRRTAPLARGLQVISTLSSHICNNDVALVILERAISLPHFEMRLDAPVTSGERITVVGYGPLPDRSLLPQTAPREHKQGIVVDAVGANSSQDTFLGVAPRSFITGGAYACDGDSGAPALAELDGRLVGVYSTQQGTSCLAGDVINHFMHLPPYRTLIEEAFEAAGYPSDPSAGGADGTGIAGGDSAGGGSPPASDTGGRASQGGPGALGTGGTATDAGGGGGESGRASEPEPTSPAVSGASGCAMSSPRKFRSSAPGAVALGLALAEALRKRRRAPGRVSHRAS